MQVLAKKMTVLYKLASGQLSKQSHYDFGLRALKAVLVMAGELKRGSPDLNEVSFQLKSVTGRFLFMVLSYDEVPETKNNTTLFSAKPLSVFMAKDASPHPFSVI